MKRTLLLAWMCANTINAPIAQPFRLQTDIKLSLPESESHKEPSIPADQTLGYTAAIVLIMQLAEGRTSLDLFSETKRWLSALNERYPKHKAFFKTVILYVKKSSHLFTCVKKRLDLKHKLTLAYKELDENQNSNHKELRDLISEILEFDTKYTDIAEREQKASEMIIKLLGITEDSDKSKEDSNKNKIPPLNSWYVSPSAYLKDTWDDVKDMWHNGLEGEAIKHVLVTLTISFCTTYLLIKAFAYFNIDIRPCVMQLVYIQSACKV